MWKTTALPVSPARHVISLSHRLAGALHHHRELKAPEGGSCRTKGDGKFATENLVSHLMRVQRRNPVD
jgi:hypothetical protein